MRGNETKKIVIEGYRLEIRVDAIDLDSDQPQVLLQLPPIQWSTQDPMKYKPTLHLLPEDAERVANAILQMARKAKSHQR